MECLDDGPGCKITVKEAIATVTTAHHTLLEHMDMLTGTQMQCLRIITADTTFLAYSKY